MKSLLEQLNPITGTADDGGHQTRPLAEAASTLTQFASRPADADHADPPTTDSRNYRPWSRVTAPLRFDDPPVRQFEQLQDELRNRDFWHRAAPIQFLQTVCDVHAAMWQRLHEWLEEPADHGAAGGIDFDRAIAEAARLSETSGVRWVMALIGRRVHRLSSADMAPPLRSANGNSGG